MLEPVKLYKVKTSDGRIWDIPESNLDAAVARGGIPMYKVKTSDGKLWDIPQNNLKTALQRGATIVNEQENNEEDSWGNQLARTAKSLVSGATGGLADTATAIYNIPAALQNASPSKERLVADPQFMGEYDVTTPTQKTELPLIPSAIEGIDAAIDSATDDYTKTPEHARSTQDAAKLVGSLLTPGGASKALAKAGYQTGAKALGALGTTNPSSLASGAAAGYVTSEASQQGYGAPASIGAGLAAGVATGATTALAKSFNTKLALATLTGNSPKNIDLEVVKAIEESGLKDFQNTVVNKSKKLAQAEQLVSKSPYFGTKYSKKLEGIDQDYAEKVEGAIKKVGEKVIQSEEPIDIGMMMQDTFSDIKTSVIKEKDKLYFASDKILPENAGWTPKSMSNTLKKIKGKINTLRPSKEEQDVLDIINDLEKIILNADGKVQVIPVKTLVGTKKSLNKTIDWDITDQGIKELLKQIPASIKRDLVQYGNKKNPQWLSKFNEADEFYAKYLGDKALSSKTLKKIFSQENPEKILFNLRDISDFRKIRQSLGSDKAGQEFFGSIKREKLNDLIAGKVIDPKSGNVNYLGFSKTLEDRKNYELVKYLAGDNYKELIALNKYAKGVYRKNQRNPNPSGTGPTSAILGATVGIMSGHGLAQKAANFTYVAAVGSALSWLVSSKTLLNYGIEAAKKQASGNFKAADKYIFKIDAAMKKDLGEDFFKQFVNLTQEEAAG